MFTKDEVIEAMAQCLNEREKEILSARWGINDGIPIRSEELKEIYGITIEQLRKIEKMVLSKLEILDLRSQLYTREQVLDAIENCLDGSERQVIITRLGIEDGITTSLRDIESRFGVSREQVREIEKKVLRYIKEHS